MTTTGTQVGSRAPAPAYYSGTEPGDRGFGWILFSATVMGIAGIMRIFDSIWAFRYHGALPENLKDTVLGSDLRTYAWLWLAVGCLLVVASALVVTRSQFARWVGIVAAAIGAISAVTWMAYYPVWSLVYVGLGILVVYGLLVYGGRAED